MCNPPEAPKAAPAIVPIMILVANWTGTLRLGVEGS
jgi:hypothetical protein